MRLGCKSAGDCYSTEQMLIYALCIIMLLSCKYLVVLKTTREG